jgi:hypothetical protein
MAFFCEFCKLAVIVFVLVAGGGSFTLHEKMRQGWYNNNKQTMSRNRHVRPVTGIPSTKRRSQDRGEILSRVPQSSDSSLLESGNQRRLTAQ